MISGMNSTKLLKAIKSHGVYGFEAVAVADYLIKKSNGNVCAALLLANSPIKINGKAVW